MRLGELASVRDWLPAHVTAADRLWQREADAVSEMELQLFYARAQLAGQRKEAIDAVDRLQGAVIMAAFDGEIDGPPAAIVLHEPPVDVFLVDELVDGLAKLPMPRRQACLYALETHQCLLDVANLFWRHLGGQQVRHTLLAAELLSAAGQTRHLKLPYVFWEWATPTIATPLLELPWSVKQAFDCSWPELVARYRRMVLVSPRANAASLLELASAQAT